MSVNQLDEKFELARVDGILKAAGEDAIEEKELDLLTPGYEVECDPEEAEAMGAFEEDAMSPEDAAEAAADGMA